jgi:hypothetical protein
MEGCTYNSRLASNKRWSSFVLHIVEELKRQAALRKEQAPTSRQALTWQATESGKPVEHTIFK